MDEMPYEELVGWLNYFEQRPVDWCDDDRCYKCLQTQGVKAKSWEIFPSLRSIYNSQPKEGFDVAKFKGSLMFHKMLGAKNGDKLDL